MPRITVELDDVLPECVESAIEEVRGLLKSFLRESSFLQESERGESPCLSNDLDYSGDVHDAIDSLVPHRTSDIEAAWFLHGRDLEEAYDTAGFGSNPREKNGMVAIYCYIEQKVSEWYHDNAAAICDECRDDSGFYEGDDE
jgi:hypothetical protein